MHRDTAPAPPAQEAIRKAATRLFAEKGFAATTTREICGAAGVTKPVLYYHFRNKEDLYRELIAAAHEDAMRQFRAAAARGATPRSKLVEVLAADFALTRREPEMARLLLHSLFAPPGETPAADLMAVATDWLELIKGLIQSGLRDGSLRGNARAIAEAVMGVHLIYTMSHLLTGKPALSRALARRIVSLVIDGCKNV
jgi:AcrR family transcriptional regulator